MSLERVILRNALNKPPIDIVCLLLYDKSGKACLILTDPLKRIGQISSMGDYFSVCVIPLHASLYSCAACSHTGTQLFILML